MGGNSWFDTVRCTEWCSASVCDSGVTAALPKPTLSLSTDFDDDGTLDRKDLEQLVNCLTGQGEESRLSSAEMEQLIQNVRALARARALHGPRQKAQCSPSPTDPGGVRH